DPGRIGAPREARRRRRPHAGRAARARGRASRLAGCAYGSDQALGLAPRPPSRSRATLRQRASPPLRRLTPSRPAGHRGSPKGPPSQVLELPDWARDDRPLEEITSEALSSTHDPLL